MNPKNFLIFLAVISILQACNHEQSRVVSFEYGSHDTTCAILNGEVYQLNPTQGSKDSLLALPDVTINAEDSTTGKIYSTSNTDASGRFSISFFKNGTFKLTAVKNGYQPAMISNFIADTGQVSKVKIILEKDHKLF